MDKIEEFLSIIDRNQRLVAMIKYAESLGVNCSEAKNPMGEYNEEKLAILIYDAQLKQKKDRQFNKRFYIIILLIGFSVFSMIIFIPKLFQQFFSSNQGRNKKDDNIVQGYDKDGKPLTEDGQPVLFKRLDGEYQEYDDKGKLKYEEVYRNGQLFKRREFDAKGAVISVIDYPQTP